MSRKTVSLAGKELLVNTIISVNHQNRRQESKECWKHLNPRTRRDVLKRPKRSYRRSRSRTSSPERRNTDNRARELSIGPEPSHRWDHSGFQELYPNDGVERRSPSPIDLSSNSSDEDDLSSNTSSSSEEEREKVKKRKKKSKHKDDIKKEKKKSKKSKHKRKKHKS